MHCYFSASHSQPPILLTYLYLAVLQTLLKKLRELSLSQTPVFFFVIDRCWLNFILHVLLFFSQLQPPPNPSDSLIPASDYSEEPKWVMFACILFYVAIIMFNNFGHVPFFSMTGKILSQGNLLMKLYHIQDNAFTANLLDHYWQICKSISSLKSFGRMYIAPNVGLAVLQLHKTFGTLIMDIYPNECEVCMSWGEFNMWFVGT